MMTLDRLKHLVAQIVGQVMARVDYHARYPARVTSQNADGTLELKPDSTRWGPGLSRVPIRHGLPGVTKLEVAQGARVLLAWTLDDDGQPTPHAELWEKGSLTSITISADVEARVFAPSVLIGDEGAAPAATLGSPVECLLPPAIPVVGTVVGPSGPMAFTGTLTVADPILGLVTGAVAKTKVS